MSDKAKCRHCGLVLDGKPYYMGGVAFHPRTREICKINYYGGFVCSRECDKGASLDLERSMPGHTRAQERLGYFAKAHYDSNWD